MKIEFMNGMMVEKYTIAKGYSFYHVTVDGVLNICYSLKEVNALIGGIKNEKTREE